MRLNTARHQQSWCCLSLHNVYVDLLWTGAEAVVLGIDHVENAPPLSSIPIWTLPRLRRIELEYEAPSFSVSMLEIDRLSERIAWIDSSFV